MSLLLKTIHIFSKVNCYLIAFCITFFALYFTFNIIPSLRTINIISINLCDLLSLILSIIITAKYVTTDSPYNKKSK